MAKTLLRNNSQSPITLPPPYTGIIAPGDAVVLDDPPSVVSDVLGIVPELITFLVVTQVPDSQPADGHDRTEAANQIASALASLSEPLDLNGQKIVNVADPTDPQDAATKAYVDAHGGGGGGGGTVTNVSSTNAYLTVANGTTTPQLTVNVGTGVNDVAAATDSRFNPAPAVTGAVVYDTGSTYAETAAGAVGQVLKVGAGGLPEWAADSTAPSGPAGGALAGFYPDPSIAAGAIGNAEVSASAGIATSKLSGLVTDIVGNGLSSLISQGTLLARTYYVAVNGNDANDGSLSAPFATLQAAHDEAPDDGTFVQILVGPGTFAGNVNVTRRNTLFIGSGSARPELKSTYINGAITVNPFAATIKTFDTVLFAGFYVNPGVSTSPAFKVTGAGLFQCYVVNCYLTTGNSAATANAIYCDATNAGRPRIMVYSSVVSTQTAGPNVAVFDRGDVRIFDTQIGHGSAVAATVGSVITVSNDATLWADRALIENSCKSAAVVATGASATTKLILSNSSLTCAYSGAEDTTHGVTINNTLGLAAYIYQTAFSVADKSASVYAINGIAPAALSFSDISFQYNTNAAISPTVLASTVPATEAHGVMVLPALASASLPLKVDASKTVIAQAITLSGSEVSGTLPIGRGGTGIATSPTQGGVVYGGATTQAYSAAGTSGQPLLSGGASAPTFGALNLATAGNVTGTLPAGNQAAQLFGTPSDVSGSTANATVVGLQGRPMAATAPASGQVVAWSGSAWEPATVAAGGGGGGSGGLTYYFNGNTVGEAPVYAIGDKEMSLTYNTGSQYNTGAVAAPAFGSQAQLAEFITNVGEPGATTIPPGVWDFNYYLLSSVASGTQFRVRLYKWDGVTLTELSQSPSDFVIIDNAGPAPAQFTASLYVEQAVLTASDRLIVKIEISSVDATTGRTVTGYFNGGTPAHTHTTLGAPGGTGIVKVVDGIVQTPASLIVNADVDTAAAIAITKLDGNAGAGGANKVLHGSATAGVAPTWSAVALGSDVSGQLPVANGGTGLSSGTAGGVPFFSASGTIASSGALTANALVIGGGASGPSALGSLGTATQVLHGNATGAPTWGAISLTADVTGTLPVAQGGTNGTAVPTAGEVAYGNGASYAFTTGSVAGKLLKSNGISPPTWLDIVPYTAGGTGTSAVPTANQVPYGTGAALTYTSGGSVGEVLGIGAGGSPEWMSNGSSPTGPALGDLSSNYPSPTVAKINGTTISTAGGALTTGTVLRVTGAASADWGALDLGAAAAVTNTLPVHHGGTGISTVPALGTIPYGDGATYALLANAAGDSGKFLKSNGVASPSWAALSFSDVSGTLTTAKGGTGLISYTAGDMLYYASGTALSKLSISGTSGAVLTTSGAAPAWSTGALITDTSVTVQQPLIMSQQLAETVTASTTISSGSVPKPYLQITAAAPTTLTSLPTIRVAGVTPGTVITLVNTGSNTIILQDDNLLSGTKIQLGGVSSRALNQYSSIDLIFDGNFWIERAVGGSGSVQSVTASAANSLITVSGTVENPKIGITGLTGSNPGTSGGIPYFSGTATLSTTTLLAANQLMVGGGAGAGPSTIASAGTAGQPLLSNGASAPAFGALDISTAAVTGTLPISKGGTGATSVTTNGVIYGASGTAYGSTAAGTTGTVLKGVTGSAPTFGAVSLTTDVSGVLPIANGGTGAATLVIGDANKVFASQDATSGAPSFRSLVAADIPTLPASKITGIPYDVAGAVTDKPPAGATIFYFKATRAFTLSATPSAHSFAAATGATSSADFTVYKNGLQVFVANFAAGGASPQSASIGTVTNNTIAVGDVITVVAPAVQDGTLANVYWTLTGTL